MSKTINKQSNESKIKIQNKTATVHQPLFLQSLLFYDENKKKKDGLNNHSLCEILKKSLFEDQFMF